MALSRRRGPAARPRAQRSAADARALKIGVTLHPYYSWTEERRRRRCPAMRCASILPGEIDAGDYQPRPDDIKKLVDLDAIVVNGIGHDDFIIADDQGVGQQEASSSSARTTRRRRFTSARGGSVNSHTFISFTNAIQQTYAIQKALAALRPQDAGRAAAERRRLRPAAARSSSRRRRSSWPRPRSRASSPSTTATATCCRSSASRSPASSQPAHGLTPSAAELRDMVELLQREKIQVVFSEETFPAAAAQGAAATRPA